MNFENLSREYIELCITKTLFMDKNYLVNVISAFKPEYFETPEVSEIFNEISSYYKKYKDLPQQEIIINSVPSKSKSSVSAYINELNSTNIDIPKTYEWLFDVTNKYLKEKSIEHAIVQSVDIIEQKQNKQKIRELIQDALCKDLKPELGLNYFEQLGVRLERMFSDEDQRLKSGFPILDEYMNGGFPPKTLSVFVSKVHGFKSNLMANIIARQILNGHDVALASLEMSEDMFAQRFDGIFSKLDINRIYLVDSYKTKLVNELSKTKDSKNRGNLYIKQYPTGKATVNDFRIWLRELNMRGVKISSFFFDYINLMKSETSNTGDLYKDGKSVSEEARSLGFEFDIPIITVSQLNRTGTFMAFDEVDFNSIADSYGIPATSDFMAIMGMDEEKMMYESEVLYKIVKNRFGGRIGEMDRFYYDSKSLKMYCSSELDVWMEDAKINNAERKLKAER